MVHACYKRCFCNPLNCFYYDIYRCASTSKAIPKDKAIKRFLVKNMVDTSALRDIRGEDHHHYHHLCIWTSIFVTYFNFHVLFFSQMPPFTKIIRSQSYTSRCITVLKQLSINVSSESEVWRKDGEF